MYVFNENNEVIGKIFNNKLNDITQSDIEVCKKLGFQKIYKKPEEENEYDAETQSDEEEEVEYDGEVEESKEDDKEDDEDEEVNMIRSGRTQRR